MRAAGAFREKQLALLTCLPASSSLLARNHMSICRSMGGNDSRIGLPLHCIHPLSHVFIKSWERAMESGAGRGGGWGWGLTHTMPHSSYGEKKMLSWNVCTCDDGTVRCTGGNGRTKADSRQWENPKTWPMLHQGIAGPIQSGSPPPPLLPAHSRPVDVLSPSSSLLFLGRLLSCFLTLLPPTLSLSSPALPASLHHRPSSSLHLLFASL